LETKNRGYLRNLEKKQWGINAYTTTQKISCNPFQATPQRVNETVVSATAKTAYIISGVSR
jgi:hypothetical protein